MHARKVGIPGDTVRGSRVGQQGMTCQAGLRHPGSMRARSGIGTPTDIMRTMA